MSLIKKESKEKVKADAIKLQEDFSNDLHDLLKKYSVRDIFICTGIPIPYEPEDCDNPLPGHAHEITAAVNMLAGDKVQVIKAFLAFMDCSPEAREVVNVALDAKELGIPTGAEVVSSHHHSHEPGHRH